MEERDGLGVLGDWGGKGVVEGGRVGEVDVEMGGDGMECGGG